MQAQTQRRELGAHAQDLAYSRGATSLEGGQLMLLWQEEQGKDWLFQPLEGDSPDPFVPLEYCYRFGTRIE